MQMRESDALILAPGRHPRMNSSHPEEPSNQGRSFLVWIPLIAVVVVLGGVAAWQFWPRPAPAVDVDQIRKEILDLDQKAKVSEALDLARSWRDKVPDDLEPHMVIVDLAAKHDRVIDAIPSAQAILQQNPGINDLRQRLVIWLFMTGQTEAADKECQILMKGRSDDPRLLMLQGDICLRLGELSRAATALDRALTMQPDFLDAMVLRGAVYVQAGEPEKAIPLLEKAIAEGVRQPVRARHYLGLALYRVGRTEDARKILSQVGQVQANEIWDKYGRVEMPSYKITLAESMLRSGQAEQGVKILEQVVEQWPDSAAAHRLLAQHYQEKGDQARAKSHREKADKQELKRE